MKKQKSEKDKQNLSDDEHREIYITQYEITDEPIKQGPYDQLPKAIRERLDTLYWEAHRKPQNAIPELLKLKKKYPRVPQIYNYLAVAYSRAGEPEKAEDITQDYIQKNPDYLFARINQAQFFIAKGDYEKIPTIFDNKFDLQMLYPKRKKFHISEVSNFMGIFGIYFSKSNQREEAEKYYELLKEIAPDYPITKMLNRELYPGIVTRIIQKNLKCQINFLAVFSIA